MIVHLLGGQVAVGLQVVLEIVKLGLTASTKLLKVLPMLLLTFIWHVVGHNPWIAYVLID
jgi:hypothetical protein